MENFIVGRFLAYNLKAILLILFSSALLLACQSSFDIKVERRGSGVELKINNDGRYAKVCISHLSIQNTIDGEYMWVIDSRGRCLPVRDITYGVVPTGFVQVVSPRPLAGRGKYLIAASGNRWVANAEFSYD